MVIGSVVRKILTLIGSIGVLSLTIISCGDDLLGKYHPAECQEVIFEPPRSLLSFYHDTSTPRLLAINSPCAPAVAGPAAPTTLFVGDGNNARVMVFDISTITNGENATNVLGQPDFTTKTAATTQSKLSAPRGLALK